jgi:hypothetical protein
LHAHSFTYLAALAKLVPATSALGAEHSFLRLLSPLSPGRSYLAALCLGLTLYAPLAGQRWFLLSRWKAIQILGAFVIFTLIPLFMTLAPFITQGSSFVAWVLLLPLEAGRIDPSADKHRHRPASLLCGSLDLRHLLLVA